MSQLPWPSGPGLPPISRFYKVFAGHKCILTDQLQIVTGGGSPGLVVMGGGSRSEGRGFESQRRKKNCK